MATSAASVWEVRTTGTALNGGGFVTGAAGTDYSLQDAKNTVGNNISNTDSVAVGTGVITSVTGSFTSAIVGNLIYMAGGTGTLTGQWYQVITFTSATSITVDRNVAAGTGITMNIGGALPSIGEAVRAAISGQANGTDNTIYIKAGTYTFTTATVNVNNGYIALQSANRMIIKGYNTVRTDYGTPPVLIAQAALGAGAFGGLLWSDATSIFANLDIDANGNTNTFCTFNRGQYYRCIARNFRNGGFLGSGTGAHATRCLATGGTTGFPAFYQIGCFYCEAYGNTVDGFSAVSIGQAFIGNISYLNTGSTTRGFLLQQAWGAFESNIAFKNGDYGFHIDGSNNQPSTFANNVAEGNGDSGYFNTTKDLILNHNAAYNNTTADFTNSGNGTVFVNENFVTGGASFFVDGDNGNFALSNAPTGGKLLKGTGFPGTLPRGTTTGKKSIGVADPDPNVVGGITAGGFSMGNPGFGGR